MKIEILIWISNERSVTLRSFSSVQVGSIYSVTAVSNGYHNKSVETFLPYHVR